MSLFQDTDHARNPLDTKCDQPLVSSFLLYMASERGLANNSLDAYRGDLEDADAYFKSQGKSIIQGDAIDWRMYLQHLRRDHKSTHTVARRLACIRGFLGYLESQGIATQGILDQLESPKPERPLPHVLGREQVNRLINAPDPESPLFWRDVAILELLYASGLRASELCDLTTQHLNLQVGAVRVLGKGSKERVVPVGNAAVEAITHYLNQTRPGLETVPSDRLFLSRTGRPFERVALWMLVKRHALACGLYAEVHPHVLRHCFASHLVSGGADLRVVQELLGHTDITTTQIYTHVDQTRLKSLHQQFHPRG